MRLEGCHNFECHSKVVDYNLRGIIGWSWYVYSTGHWLTKWCCAEFRICWKFRRNSIIHFKILFEKKQQSYLNLSAEQNQRSWGSKKVFFRSEIFHKVDQMSVANIIKLFKAKVMPLAAYFPIILNEVTPIAT